MSNIKREELTKEELVVCRILYFAFHDKRGICDPTNFSEEDEQILLDFQEKGYLTCDVNCLILTKEFKEFLEELFKEEE